MSNAGESNWNFVYSGGKYPLHAIADNKSVVNCSKQVFKNCAHCRRKATTIVCTEVLGHIGNFNYLKSTLTVR